MLKLRWHTVAVPQSDLSEIEYLRHIEHLAREIVNAADREEWLTLAAASDGATPLQRSVIETARRLRHHRFGGDGCLDEDLPLMKLAGVVILRPHAVPVGMEESCTEICTRLEVEARSEGWTMSEIRRLALQHRLPDHHGNE